MELLDELRDHRVADSSGKLRMVYTGSVGLHLVISELVHRGYRNDPTNDMATLSLGGIEHAHATALGQALLRGLATDDELTLAPDVAHEEIARRVAQQTDGLPYYIHHTFDRLSDLGRPVTVDDVPVAIESLLDAPDDPAHFAHYAERIEAYYVFDDHVETTAYALLDALSRADTPMTESQLQDVAAAHVEGLREVALKKTLDHLVKDRYLVREQHEGERIYRFRYGLIQKWWVRNRA
jgi:uncharacterized protein